MKYNQVESNKKVPHLKKNKFKFEIETMQQVSGKDIDVSLNFEYMV